jgi:hypothetical protein
VLCIQLSLASIFGAALHTVSEKVGGGNFTYIKFYDKGAYQLVLESISGDADLYISDTNSQPDWEDYEFHSVTCGEDSVRVPVDMKRPVYIGVYGHPSHELSVYALQIFSDTSAEQEDREHLGVSNKKRRTSPSSGPDSRDDEPESLLWTIIVGILKILLDILVS